MGHRIDLRRARAALALLAFALLWAYAPSAQAATQTLTVTKAGTGTGTVTSSPAGINCGSTCSFAFAEGQAVTLTGTPGVNSAAVKWSGCDSVNLEGKCKVTMSAAKGVTATFDLLKRKLSVSKAGTGAGTVTSAPAGIECGPTCSAEYDSGAEVTLTGSPGANAEAVKWSGCASVTGEGKCLVTMTAAKSVTATFDLGKRELKVARKGTGTGTVTSSPTGIACGATCSFVFNQGATVTLTGTPSGEAQAAKWSGCDSVTAEGKCVVAMSAAREVVATFNLPSYMLTVTKPGNGTGTVTSSPAAIACGTTCSEGFLKGQSVTLTGASGLHTKAVKWSGCDSVNAKGQCLVTMSAAKTVIATFALERQWTEYMVTVQRKGTGKGTVTSAPAGIQCGEDCSQAYLYATQLTLTATPAEGSVFKEWTGGGCPGQTGPCTTAVIGPRLIRAIFTAVGNRTLSVAKAGSGQGTVTSKAAGIDCGSVCSVELDASTRVTLQATAAPGSTFSGWSGEGCVGTATCRVLMNEARNLTATFARAPGPSSASCRVPRLIGKTLGRARAALAAANCSLGAVRKPRAARLSELRVRSSSPPAGTVLAPGSRVALKLARIKRR